MLAGFLLDAKLGGCCRGTPDENPLHKGEGRYGSAGSGIHGQEVKILQTALNYQMPDVLPKLACDAFSGTELEPGSCNSKERTACRWTASSGRRRGEPSTASSTAAITCSSSLALLGIRCKGLLSSPLGTLLRRNPFACHRCHGFNCSFRQDCRRCPRFCSRLAWRLTRACFSWSGPRESK